MPKWPNSLAVWRVSSQATRSTERRTRSARRVMSSRLPMGVATRYKPGARGRSEASACWSERLAGAGSSITAGLAQACCGGAHELDLLHGPGERLRREDANHF